MISISPGKIPSWSSSHPVIWVESIGCPKLGAWPHGGSACPANDFTSPNLNNRSRKYWQSFADSSPEAKVRNFLLKVMKIAEIRY